MATARDIAAYIKEKSPAPMPRSKLNGLMYFTQAWSMAWTGKPVFAEPIKAHASGPEVVGLGNVDSLRGHPVDDATEAVLERVLRKYADMSTRWLLDLVTTEVPFVEARAANPGATIKLESLALHYGK